MINTHIRYIEVSNFRSLHNFSLNLNLFNTLIGRNDAGKSNILRAIRLLLNDDASQELTSFDWCRSAKVIRFPREVIISAGVGGDKPYDIRRRFIVKSDSATSILEVKGICLFES